MKKYAAIVGMLTGLILLFMTGWFLVRQVGGAHWTVEVEREEYPAASVSEESHWPDSLLEGEIININTASAADLQRLPGIGAGRAEAIIAYRKERGPFSRPEELRRVDGIGPGIFEAVQPYITTG